MFTSECGAPFGTAGFARMLERAGSEAKLGFKAHPHMLRHACGYALANKGHDTRALQDTWATATFSTPCDTLTCRQHVLRISGETKAQPISKELRFCHGLYCMRSRTTFRNKFGKSDTKKKACSFS